MQQRKIASMEDLFETQRRELFARLSEMDKVHTTKSLQLQRCIQKIAIEAKIEIS